MDDFTETFTIPSWPDVNAMPKLPWDYHGGAVFNALGHLHYAASQKVLPAQLNHQQSLSGILANFTRSSATNSISEIDNGSLVFQEAHEASAFDALRRMQEGSSPTCSPGSTASGSSDVASSVINPVPASAPAWPQSYMEEMQLKETHCSRVAKLQRLTQQRGTQNHPYLCKRSQIENAGQNQHPFSSVSGLQAQESQARRQQVSHGIPVNQCNTSHTELHQEGSAGLVPVTARPRVRARRGQATDPHSIAERLRRERIADRIKALQELVPSVNKTDKALMLDEIIDYVKFLQLQVKILNVSRLRGTGAMIPVIADLSSEGIVDITSTLKEGNIACSSEDNLLMTEQHVAKLMEESMGSALQFLQSKGLCLMPIFLAAAVSSRNNRHLAISSHVKTDTISLPDKASPSPIMPMTSLQAIGDILSGEVCAGAGSSRDCLWQAIIGDSIIGAPCLHK